MATVVILSVAMVACGSSENSTDGDEQSESVSADSIAVKADGIVTAYTDFLRSRDINAGAISVSYDGNPVASSGINRLPSDSAPVASLSKAITAVCTFKALDMSGFLPETTIGELLPYLGSTELTVDERMKQITVAQLITHNSGIHTAHISVLGGSIPTMQAEQKVWQLDFIISDGLAADPGSGYYYANANYLILGLVIEQLTGADYVDWCLSNVLEPLDITSASMSALWAVLSSFGGWQISALDYQEFVNAYFGNGSVLGENPETFSPKLGLDEGGFYGPGVFMIPTATGYRYSHAGSFTWTSIRQSGRFGSYFVSYPNGYSVSLNLDSDLRGDRLVELRDTLDNAAF